MLDTARLTRMIIDPTAPLSLQGRSEDAQFRDTVVTLLLDNSGSMRGRPIMVAAVCADILARTLERCAVKVEILGFTTRAWKGGSARDEWISAGKPTSARPPERPAPHHLQGGRRALAAGQQEPGPDDARGAAEGEHRRRGPDLGAPAAWSAGPRRGSILMVISDGAPVDDSTQSANAAHYLERHLRQVIAEIETTLAGRADRHRHRPRRDPLVPPRGDHRRRRTAGRGDDREAGRTVRQRSPRPAAEAARRAA